MDYKIDSGLAKDFKPALGDVFIDRDITEPIVGGNTRNVYVLSNLANPEIVPNSFGYLSEDGEHLLFMGGDSAKDSVDNAFNKLAESVELVIGKNYFPNDITTVLYQLYENSGSLNNTTTTTTTVNPDTITTTTLSPEDIDTKNMVEVLMAIRLGLRMAHMDYKYAMNAPSRFDEHGHIRKVNEEIMYASNLLTRLLMKLDAPIDYDTWDGSNYLEYLKKNIPVDTDITDHFPNNPKDLTEEINKINSIGDSGNNDESRKD